MIFRYLITVSLILATYIVQGSLIAVLPYPLNLVSLPLVVIVIMTYVFGLQSGLLGALALGTLATHDANLQSFTIILTYFIIAVAINFLSEKLFTNKSLYSNSVLCLIGTVLQSALVLAANFVNTSLDAAFFRTLIWQVALNLLASDIIFTLLISFRQELKSYLLVK